MLEMTALSDQNPPTYYVYVIRSERTGRHYKGHCKDLATRLEQHNAGKTKSTRAARPWVLVYHETFQTRSDAVAREKFLKTLAGGKELRLILNP